MKRTTLFTMMLLLGATFTSCKKDKEEEESTPAENTYAVPTTYSFEDENGNSTVSFSGQTERLDQLSEITSLMTSGNSQIIDAQDLKDMYANTGGNGNGNFSFESTKQLKNKTFGNGIDASTQEMFEMYMDEIATASASYMNEATDGQAGVLTTGSSTYLMAANGYEYKQLIEKGLMGAVFYYQANAYYLSDDQIGEDVDNTDAVDPDAGKFYTTMEHHWDEAFGYFGVPVNFPTEVPDRFWGKYADARDEAGLLFEGEPVNEAIMNAFLAGRAAISNQDASGKNKQVEKVRMVWENICAAQAIHYLEAAQSSFGNDNAKFLHVLSEAYAFINSLKYSPVETRRMTPQEVDLILDENFGDNLWEVTLLDLAEALNSIEEKYEF